MWMGYGADGSPVSVPSSWEPWDSTVDTSRSPYITWFNGGRTNAAFNEVDRHVLEGYGESIAIIYEGLGWDPDANHGLGEALEMRHLTYADLMLESAVAALVTRSCVSVCPRAIHSIRMVRCCEISE